MPTQMSRRPRSFVYRRVLKRPLVNRAVLSLLLRVVSRTVSNVERTFTVWSRAIHSGFHNDDASALGFHPVTHANSSASQHSMPSTGSTRSFRSSVCSSQFLADLHLRDRRSLSDPVGQILLDAATN